MSGRLIRLGTSLGRARHRVALGRRWRRAELAVALVCMAGGFVAVFFGWLEASGTADVRIQIQDCLSGGIGGLALLVTGAVIAHAAVSDRLAGRSEELLGQLVAAVRYPAAVAAEAAGGRPEELVATGASFHLSSCDVLDPATSTTVITARQARRQGLSACRVCVPEQWS
jgi:hypothetical protein